MQLARFLPLLITRCKFHRPYYILPNLIRKCNQVSIAVSSFSLIFSKSVRRYEKELNLRRNKAVFQLTFKEIEITFDIHIFIIIANCNQKKKKKSLQAIICQDKLPILKPICFFINKKVPGIRLDTGDPHLKRRLPTLPLAQYHRRCEA